MANQVKVQRKLPTRRCVGCGEHFPKNTLIRVVRSPEGEVTLDATGKASGRGVYICKDAACLKKARKARRFESSLGVTIPDAVYARLERQLGSDE